MAKTRINCPNCRQPVTADIEMLFDVNVDPAAKQRLLSGAFNVMQCPSCGYQGTVAAPIVYHDPDKELLLTFLPPDITRPRQEQERQVGPMINQVVNNLPQEKRKAYLFRPQDVLTLQGLIERVLEADGITREMVQAQQQKLNLLQRLLNASDDVLAEIVKQEESLMDHEFFGLFNRLIETVAMQGDREGAQRLADLQNKLLPITKVGRELQAQAQEVEAAIKSLQEAGRGLTREKLLELVIDAPNDTRLSVLASFARPGMDYNFFQLLSERIDQASGDEKTRLAELRDKLLDMTNEIDKQMEERANQTKELLDELLQQPDIVEATQANLGAFDELFVQVLNTELNAARQSGDLGRLEKLQKVVGVLQQASAPPPELTLIEKMLELETEEERRAWLQEHKEEITPQFMETLGGFLSQTQSGEDPELYNQLQVVYRSALRFSMENNLKQ